MKRSVFAGVPGVPLFVSLAAFLPMALSPLAAQVDPARVGRWEQPRPWPIIGIHAAVLPTGQVLHMSYLVEGAQTGTVATVWNPASGKFRDVTPGFGDMFCSGQNFLADGRLFISGGLRPQNCSVQGTRETYVFDPIELTWSETGTMRSPRFYPTVLALPDGRQLIIGGQGENCQYVPVMEIFDPRKGLSVVRGPNRIMRDYPRAFLLSSGEVAHVAPEPTTSVLNPQMKFWTSVAVTRLGRMRYEASAFYVPGREDHLMLCGGYLDRSPTLELDNPTASCEMIDLSSPRPSWSEAAPMRAARGDANAVLLPDGKVLVVGGGEHHRYDSPILNPELYDPEANSWTVVAQQSFGRMYHSTAVLLPDGRVLSAGQDDDGAGDGVVSGAWGEIYQPPYLFRGKRPKIRRAPDRAAYNTLIELEVKKAARTRSVVLMGLSAVTHATNVGQRYVPLEFTVVDKGTLRARITKSPNLAPPGYYMLFVLNDKRVPSVASIIHIDPSG